MRVNTLIYGSLLICLGAVTSAAAMASGAIRTHQVSVQLVAVEIVADDGRVFARYDLPDRSGRGALRAYLEAERGHRGSAPGVTVTTSSA